MNWYFQASLHASGHEGSIEGIRPTEDEPTKKGENTQTAGTALESLSA